MSAPYFCDPCGNYHARNWRGCEALVKQQQEIDLDRLAELVAEKIIQRLSRARQAQSPLPDLPLISGPSLADLEALRWGDGGREHFGDPRPTDRFPRKGSAA